MILRFWGWKQYIVAMTDDELIYIIQHSFGTITVLFKFHIYITYEIIENTVYGFYFN